MLSFANRVLLFGVLMAVVVAAGMSCSAASKGSEFTGGAGSTTTFGPSGPSGPGSGMGGFGFGGNGSGGGMLQGDPKTCAEAAMYKTYVGCDFWPTVVANEVW